MLSSSAPRARAFRERFQRLLLPVQLVEALRQRLLIAALDRRLHPAYGLSKVAELLVRLRLSPGRNPFGLFQRIRGFLQTLLRGLQRAPGVSVWHLAFRPRFGHHLRGGGPGRGGLYFASQLLVGRLPARG